MKRCLCGCGLEARGKSMYFSSTHRTRFHKDKKAREGLTRVEAKRLRDRQAKAAARAAGSIRSDDRLSFERAVTEVTDYLATSWPSFGLGEAAIRSVAEAEAREVLARARPRR